jgi:hypothetical protein
MDVGWEWVSGGDGVVAGLDVDGAVAAEGGDGLSDRPAGGVLDPAGDGQGGEHDGRVRSIESLVRWKIGRVARSDVAIRKPFSMWNPHV